VPIGAGLPEGLAAAIGTYRQWERQSGAAIGSCRNPPSFCARVKDRGFEGGVYLPAGPVTPVTSPANTGFFERQPVYKPVTNLCQPVYKGSHGVMEES
jgi:hypothetical protein